MLKTAENYLTVNIIGAGCIGHLLTVRLLKAKSSFKININLYTKTRRRDLNLEYCSPKRLFNQTIKYSLLNQWKDSSLIIICVKSPQFDEVCQQLLNLSSSTNMISSTPILILMNGMGLMEQASVHFPNNPIFQAVTTHGAKFDQNKLIHTGDGETHIGSYKDQNNEKHLKVIYGLLNHGLPTAYLSDNIDQSLWKKLLVNAIINPLTTIHHVENGQIISNLEIKKQSTLLCEELIPLIHQLEIFESSQQLFEQVCLVANKTKNNISSMQQDHLNHRPSEIDSITGYLLDTASNLKIDLPLHKEIYRKIKRLENHF